MKIMVKFLVTAQLRTTSELCLVLFLYIKNSKNSFLLKSLQKKNNNTLRNNQS